jgi:hypothetical protein
VQEGGAVTDTTDGRIPVAVPAGAIRAGEAEAPARSDAEPSVWTDRMLATLEEGVKGGKWYSLRDKVWAERTLRAAAAKVVANRGSSGVDHVTALHAVTIIGDGPTPSLPSTGSSACSEPMPRPASPLAGKTANRRAGCGRSASPVRREGAALAAPYPYQKTVTPSAKADRSRNRSRT